MPRVEHVEDIPSAAVRLQAPDGSIVTRQVRLMGARFVAEDHSDPDAAFYVETNPEQVEYWDKLLADIYVDLLTKYGSHEEIPIKLRDNHRTAERPMLIKFAVQSLPPGV